MATLLILKLKDNPADDPGTLIAKAFSTGMVEDFWVLFKYKDMERIGAISNYLEHWED